MQIILRSSLGVLVLFTSLLAIFPCVNPAPALAGTTTLVTYYPAPNGNYSKVTLYPQTQPSGVCRSGAMYVDNTTGAVGYCVDNNINSSDGTIIGGTLAGTGTWGKFQASTPINFNDVANKGYVDAAGGGGPGSWTCTVRQGTNAPDFNWAQCQGTEKLITGGCPAGCFDSADNTFTPIPGSPFGNGWACSTFIGAYRCTSVAYAWCCK